MGLLDRFRPLPNEDTPEGVLSVVPAEPVAPEMLYVDESLVERRLPTDWARLPPISTVIGRQSLTLREPEYGIASLAVPAITNGELGHAVTADGPIGFVEAQPLALPEVQAFVDSGSEDPQPDPVVSHADLALAHPIPKPVEAFEERSLYDRLPPHMRPLVAPMSLYASNAAAVTTEPTSVDAPIVVVAPQPAPAPASFTEASMPLAMPALPMPSQPVPDEWKVPVGPPESVEAEVPSELPPVAADAPGAEAGSSTATAGTDAGLIGPRAPGPVDELGSGLPLTAAPGAPGPDMPLAVAPRRDVPQGQLEPRAAVGPAADAPVPAPTPDLEVSTPPVEVTGVTDTPPEAGIPSVQAVSVTDASPEAAEPTPGPSDVTATTESRSLVGSADPVRAISPLEESIEIDAAQPEGVQAELNLPLAIPPAARSDEPGQTIASRADVVDPTAPTPETVARIEPSVDVEPPATVGLVAANPPDAPLVGLGERMTPQTGAASEQTTTADVTAQLPPSPVERPLLVRGRSGLGEPMEGLPATARSSNVSSITAAQQAEITRVLFESRLAAARDANPAAFPPLTPRPQAGPGPLPLGRAPKSAPDVAPVPALADPNRFLPGRQPDGVVEGIIETIAPLVGLREPFDPEPAESDTTEGDAVRADVGSALGMDLYKVAIDRSPEAAMEAHMEGARAFTTNSGIVIPASVGTLNSGEGAALLAHELTHVAQRTRLGPSVPDERSPVGRALEREAKQTEMVYTAGGQLGSSARIAPEPTSLRAPASPHDLPITRAFLPELDRSSRGGMPLAAASPPAPPDVDAITETVLNRVTGMMPQMEPRTEVFNAPSFSAPAPAAAGMQRAAVEGDVQPAPTLEHPGVEEDAQEPGRPSDQELTNLSRWLYPLIRYRLRKELRDDRERAGLLTDHYKRW